jgi:paraquat-inducible protein B
MDRGSTNNGDYTGLLNKSLSFSDGQTSATVTAAITNDTQEEVDETFWLIVQRNPSEGASCMDKLVQVS